MPRVRLLKLTHEGQASLHGVVPGDDKGESHEGVYYTHLPAHETSLHIVCRLLLEKQRGLSLPVYATRTMTQHSDNFRKSQEVVRS